MFDRQLWQKLQPKLEWLLMVSMCGSAVYLAVRLLAWIVLPVLLGLIAPLYLIIGLSLGALPELLRIWIGSLFGILWHARWTLLPFAIWLTLHWKDFRSN